MDDGGTKNDPGGQPRGLEAGELAGVVAELRDQVLGMRVRDLALLRDGEDLLLVLVDENREKRALHIALGNRRARLCTTRRRFPNSAFATGPRSDRLRGALLDARLVSVEHAAGEKRCSLGFEGDAGLSVMEVELFGARGLWCLVGGDGHILQLSRRARGLEPGGSYTPPATPPPPGGGGSSRFSPPVLEAVDRHFTAEDREGEVTEERRVLERALANRRRKLETRLAGLDRQAEQISGVDELRRKADLMLAHSGGVARGAAEMTVPDPDRPGEDLRLTLDPSRPVVSQAEALYVRARKLADGAAVSRQRRAEAEGELEAVASLEAALGGEEPLVNLRARVVAAGYLAMPKKAPVRKARKPAGEPFRRYTSREGHPILVGRNNAQNDRLSIQVARGNDLWFHVGGGRAGSHVVVRLPRGKTASLETLLDAGTLAVHFSKYRGTPICEVIYARAKHVRKPKGLPPGRVHVTQTKSLGIRLEADRLERLLGSTENV